jgi:ubiquinone/menaquinone biosynthesis C-methylase UbiE
MEGTGKLRIWEKPDESGSAGGSSAATTSPLGLANAGPHHPADFAEQLFASEALQPPALSLYTEDGPEPFSLQWFLQIERQRHSRQGRWIPKLMEFAKHNGERLLGLGHGLGTDWLQYARHGAQVVVCSPAPSQLTLVRRNFELRGLEGRFLHATPSCLPLQSASIDVACISGLLETVADPNAVVHEVYRVLKPGGKILAATPARYDADFFYRTCNVWHRWFRGVTPAAGCLRFSARRLRRLFAAFVERRVHKRHLRRSEAPHLLRWLPLPLLERLFGHVLVIKAFKPLSAAMSPQVAAA